MKWRPRHIKRMAALRLAGASYGQIAKALGPGFTRNSVKSAYHHHVLGEPSHGGATNHRRDSSKPLGQPALWDEDYLTERWVDRKRRRESVNAAGDHGHPAEGLTASH